MKKWSAYMLTGIEKIARLFKWGENMKRHESQSWRGVIYGSWCMAQVVTVLALIFMSSTLTLNNAYALTMGPYDAGLGENIQDGGTDWTNVTNIYSNNSNNASVSLGSGDQSDLLRATNFGFSIPAGATIDGITVEIEKAANYTSMISIYDVTIQLVKNLVSTGDNKADTLEWPTTEVYRVHGGSADTWGATWTADDINSSNFGVIIKVSSGANNRTAYVDHVRITVDYTLDCTPTGSLSVTAGQTLTGNPVDLTSISSYTDATNLVYTVTEGATPTAITIGYGASLSSYGNNVDNYTIVDKANPANATGTITEVQFYANSTGTMTVFTASYDGTYWIPRAKTSLTISTTGYQTAAVNLEVQTGDIIGYYSSNVEINYGQSGGTGFRAAEGVDYTSIGTSYTALDYEGYRLNLAGTGTTPSSTTIFTGDETLAASVDTTGWTDGTYTLIVEGDDINCGTPLTPASDTFTWHPCITTGFITVDAGQALTGNPIDLTSISSYTDATNLVYTVTEEATPTAITIGFGASSSSYGNNVDNYTIVDEANPANDTGTITEVQFYANSTGTMTVFTASYDGTNWIPRARISLTVSTTGYQTAAVSLEVQTGDIIGYYSSNVEINYGSNSGTGFRAARGVDYTSIGTSYTASRYGGYRLNLAGTGTTPSSTAIFTGDETMAASVDTTGWTDGTYTLIVEGDDSNCGTPLTPASDTFTWHPCITTGLITIDAGQSVSGDPYDAGTLISSQSGVNSIEYKVTTSTTIPDTDSDWGMTSAGGNTSNINYTRLMSGNAPAASGMKLQSVSIYVGANHADQVRLAVYSGGSLTTGPTGATLLYDFGTTNGSATNQWLTLTYSGPDIIIPAGQPLWVAFKSNSGSAGFDVTYNINATGTDWQTGNGRWNSGAVSFDETQAYPSTWPSDSGSFGAFWYAMYITYASGGGTATTICTDWTTSSSIPVTTAGGSGCGDYTDGGTHTIEMRAIDDDCGSTVLSTPNARDFIWNSCVDPDLAALSIFAPPDSGIVSGTYRVLVDVTGEVNPENMTNMQISIPAGTGGTVVSSAPMTWDGVRWYYDWNTLGTHPDTITVATGNDQTISIQGNDPDCATPVSTSRANIAVDNTDGDPASLVLTNPLNGATVSSVLTVQVRVDGESAPDTMQNMQISIPAGPGGSAVSSAAMSWNGTSSRWEYTWNTTATHPQTGVQYTGVTIDVQGDDPDNGATVNDQVSVTVDNRVNSTTAGVASAVAATGETIDVTMPYTNDLNGNNTYTVLYKLTSAGSYTTWVENAAHTTSPYTTTITGLTALTSYDVRVVYNDVDGVNGSAVQDFTLITPAHDSGSPDAISDLAVTSWVGSHYLTLTWTATGDDPGDIPADGTSAALYDLRYSKRPIVESGADYTETDWSGATSVTAAPTFTILPVPFVIGTTETLLISGLESNTIYYFAVKATDELTNTSLISNIAAGKIGLLYGWNMVSAPLTPSPNDTASVFGDNAANDSMHSWTPTGATNPDTNGFWTQMTVVTRDQGLLIWSKKTDSPTDAAGTSNVAATTSIPLLPGFNLIGTPYEKIINLIDCQVDDGVVKSYAQAVADGSIDNVIWTWTAVDNYYTSSRYDEGAALQPWKAYWIYTDGNVTLIVPDPDTLP